MNELSTLFKNKVATKATNKDKIYTWNITVNIDGDNIFLITSHGELDGKQVIHKKEIKSGKGKKTKYEQALFDAKSKHRCKMEKECYVNDINNVGKNKQIRPMLACTFNFASLEKKSRAKNITFPAFCQPKYDGIRCIAYINDDNLILESRNGVKFHNLDHIRSDLKDILLKNNNIYLDGELYTSDLTFEVLSGLTRLVDVPSKTDLKKINKLDYILFDCINLNNMDQKYKDRYKQLEKMYSGCANIKVTSNYLIKSSEEIKKKHNEYILEGYEGLMLRNIDSKYEVQKRSKDLQKYKEFMEEEFLITGFHEGKGGEKGTVIWECVTKEKKPFSVRPRGTREFKTDLFNNGDKYIGKKLTVIFQEYSAEKIPRFPVGKAIRENY